MTTINDEVLKIEANAEGISGWMAFETENPFIHPVFGKFISFEGFWYYIKSHGTNTDARFVSNGWGRSRCRATAVPVDNFDEIIYEGYYYMLKAMPPEKLQPILNNTRRFTFFYTTQSGEKVHTSYAWAAEGIARAIQCLRDGVEYPRPDYGTLLFKAKLD